MTKCKHCITIIGILILVLAIWDMVAPLSWASVAFLVLGILLIAHEASISCPAKPAAPPLAAKPAPKQAKKAGKKRKK